MSDISLNELTQCRKCGEYKSRDEFYKSKSSKNGLQAKCKSCFPKGNERRQVDRRYGASEKGKATHKKYDDSDKGKSSQRKRDLRQREIHYDRIYARQIVSDEIKAGRLVKPSTCSVENCNKRPEAHHDDYSLPLVVRWLCRKHHKEAEQEKRERQCLK